MSQKCKKSRPFFVFAVEFLSSQKGRLFCYFSLTEGMQYTVGLLFIYFFHMYYKILLLMTDEYTELI